MTSTPVRREPRTAPSSTYGAQMCLVLLAAFTLSAIHTTYAWIAGIDDPRFTVTTPAAWAFYAVSFGVAALARREDVRLQRAVVGYLVLLCLVAVFYYPTAFGPRQQTTFGWFENDVYVALLGIGLYLGCHRLRRTTITEAGC